MTIIPIEITPIDKFKRNHDDYMERMDQFKDRFIEIVNEARTRYNYHLTCDTLYIGSTGSPESGYCNNYGSTIQVTMYEDIIKYGTDEEVLAYFKRELYYHFNAWKRSDCDAHTDLEPFNQVISEFVGDTERCIKRREEFLKKTSLFKKNPKNLKPLDDVVNRLKALNLICDADLENIEIRWYTSDKYQYNYMRECSRKKLLIAPHKALSTAPDYVLDFNIYYAIKIMNAEYQLEVDEKYEKEFYEQCLSMFPTEELIKREINYIGRYKPNLNMKSS